MSGFEAEADRRNSADGVRKRRIWESLETEQDLHKSKDLTNEESELVVDDVGRDKFCPLASGAEVVNVLKVEISDFGLGNLFKGTKQADEEFVRAFWVVSWYGCDFRHLPRWMQDNDYLHTWHRPQLESFADCFKSIFWVHTETGNIWTHLLGCLAFATLLLMFVINYFRYIPLADMLAIGTFYVAAIFCFGVSFLFHTVYCHSEFVSKLFNKLDYCGISIQITGSFVPWLYYGFYCQNRTRDFYLVLVLVLCASSMFVSLWDKFSESRYRPVRTSVFAVFGLTGVVPVFHYVMSEGWFNAVAKASLGWVLLMALFYIFGAFIYAFRFPECLYPGKFDIWFQSHQIFHVLTIAAAFSHLYGITKMLTHRMAIGECAVEVGGVDGIPVW